MVGSCITWIYNFSVISFRKGKMSTFHLITFPQSGFPIHWQLFLLILHQSKGGTPAINQTTLSEGGKRSEKQMEAEGPQRTHTGSSILAGCSMGLVTKSPFTRWKLKIQSLTVLPEVTEWWGGRKWRSHWGPCTRCTNVVSIMPSFLLWHKDTHGES